MEIGKRIHINQDVVDNSKEADWEENWQEHAIHKSYIDVNKNRGVLSMD